MQNIKNFNFSSITNSIENRLKNLNLNRQIFNNIKTIEDFFQIKLKFSQFLFDLDEDIREILQNFKTTDIQIKELKDQIDFLNQKYNNLENKLTNSETYNIELKNNNKDFFSQINCLNENLLNYENHIKKLENKNKTLEDSKNIDFNNDNLILIENNTNNNSFFSPIPNKERDINFLGNKLNSKNIETKNPVNKINSINRNESNINVDTNKKGIYKNSNEELYLKIGSKNEYNIQKNLEKDKEKVIFL